jgi:hypothetical protein
MIYYINRIIQHLGTTLDYSQDAILSTIHLYNAAKQAGCLTNTWPDLDYLISLHTPKHPFSGNLPTERKDFFKRFYLAFGAGALNFAKNRRDKKFEKRMPGRQDVYLDGFNFREISGSLLLRFI